MTTARTILVCSVLVSWVCASGPQPLRNVLDKDKKVLLVQNFKNATVDGAKWDPWKLGIPSLLQEDLLRVGYFRVISDDARRGAIDESALQRTGLTRDAVVRIGRLLGAQWILSGDFTVVGTDIRITVQVIDVATAEVVSAAADSGSASEFFSVAKGVSLRLIGSFKFNLTKAEVEIIQSRVETKNVDASLNNYSGEEYLRELKFLEYRKEHGHLKPGEEAQVDRRMAELRKLSRERFRRALDADPAYERARENLNKTTLMLPSSV